MAMIQGVKEKLHYPLYDCFFVSDKDPKKTFLESMNDPRSIRFFVDVQGKTKLETNMPAAGVLASRNTYEARSLRVVVSDLRFPPSVTPSKDTLKVNLQEGEITASVIYHSVTTFYVGEKIMHESPTWNYPGGAGVFPGFPTVSNHGLPSPEATFRFAEPVLINEQQSFRVEISSPPSTTLAGAKGPFRIWVLLDGYLTRDVQ
jgi:hypothetical protein